MHALRELFHAQRLGCAQLLLQAGHADPLQPAGSNDLKGLQAFVVNVDGKAVHADPFFDPHTDRGDFALLNPHAGKTFALAGTYPVALQGIDERQFDSSQELVQVATVVVQINQRIAHQLTRTMVGSLTAAIGLEYRMRQLPATLQAALVAGAADGVNRAVLQIQHALRVLLLLDRRGEIELFLQGLGIILLAAQPEVLHLWVLHARVSAG